MSTVSTWVAVLALILGYVAVVAAYFALRTLAKLRRATAVLARGARGPEAHASLIEATQRNTERIEIVAEEIADLRALVADATAAAGNSAAGGGRPSKDTPNAVGPGGLRNVALVRYDAFGEMSGRLSFSLALLDDEGDGVTISAIAGQSDTRVYAKGVASGKGEHELTPEEKQAVTSALGKKRLFSRSA